MVNDITFSCSLMSLTASALIIAYCLGPDDNLVFITVSSSYASFMASMEGKEYSCFIPCLRIDAYESAKLLCEQYYLGAPELELRQINGEKLTKH